MKAEELHKILHRLDGDVEVVLAVNETGYSESVVKLTKAQEAQIAPDDGEGMYEICPEDEAEFPDKVLMLLLVPDDKAAYCV